MILLIFGLILSDQLISAALFGEQSSWSDNGKIVKVYSHDEKYPSNVQACSGSIVSPNLVLAATECIKFNNATLNKHMILLNPERFPTNNKIYATAVENIDEWTLFKLEKTFKIEALCPVNESRKNLMNVKLNIGVSNYRIHLRDLAADNKCFFYGFETNSDSNNFKNQTILRKNILKNFNLKELRSGKAVSNASACWQDIGSPVICTFSRGDFQVGIIQKLIFSTTEYDEAISEGINDAVTLCSTVKQIEIIIVFNSFNLMDAIDKHDFQLFKDAYFACDYIGEKRKKQAQ